MCWVMWVTFKYHVENVNGCVNDKQGQPADGI